MVPVGTRAPQFGCSAWINDRLRRLSWSELHSGNTLVLLFDAAAARLYDGLDELNQAACRLQALSAKTAVVCHGPLRMIEDWAADTLARGDPFALTVIVDPEDHLAARYELVSEDSVASWGQIIIDGAGFVRQVETCSCRLATNADGLVQCVGYIANLTNGNSNHLEERT